MKRLMTDDSPVYILLYVTVVAMLVYASASAGYHNSYDKLSTMARASSAITTQASPYANIAAVAGHSGQELFYDSGDVLRDRFGFIEVKTQGRDFSRNSDHVRVIGRMGDAGNAPTLTVMRRE